MPHADQALTALPRGYLPVGEITDMALAGRWTPLDDGMSPCWPSRIVSAMELRRDLGDRDAGAWLALHARAHAGDPPAQRAFGRVCENGSYRSPADLQRAFFWYYRAGRQGNVEARRDAQRLMRCAPISSATMAEPVLVYPGLWRITACLSPALLAASVFELADGGTASGSLAGYGDPNSTAESRRPECPPAAAGPAYRGGWAYDGFGNVLTIIFESAGGAARQWRADHWQIAVTGCRPGSLFGRDRRTVGYVLECLTR